MRGDLTKTGINVTSGLLMNALPMDAPLFPRAASLREVTLADKCEAPAGRIFISGIQELVKRVTV